MLNENTWQPSKYTNKGDSWRVSHSSKALNPASRFSSSLALADTVEAIKRHARGHLADFGCGEVPFYGVYRNRVSEVTCIDWPQSSHETSHIDVVADLNKPIPVADSSFDTVLCSSVLEHIWNHDVFWNEMTRSLRPGGRIILIVPFLYWLHEEPFDYFRWTRHALTRACTERGLTVLQLEPYGGGIDVMADLFVRSLAQISLRVAGWVGTAFARVLARKLARRLSPVSYEKLPLGYLLVAERSP